MRRQVNTVISNLLQEFQTKKNQCMDKHKLMINRIFMKFLNTIHKIKMKKKKIEKSLFLKNLLVALSFLRLKMKRNKLILIMESHRNRSTHIFSIVETLQGRILKELIFKYRNIYLRKKILKAKF